MPGACRAAAKLAAKREGLNADEALAEAHVAREPPSKGLTLELSGARQRVRLNDWLGEVCLVDDDCMHLGNHLAAPK